MDIVQNYFRKFSIRHSPFSTSLGFTLIEIIIAVALVGVLATWVVILVDPAVQFKKGRDAERKSELRQLQTALELYRANQGIYPVGPLPDCGSPFIVDDVTYIQRIPCDPKNTGDLVYHYDGSLGYTYILVACLENVSDPQKDPTNDATYCTDEDESWSYTVINP